MTDRRHHDVGHELELVERVSAWPGHAGRDWYDRLSGIAIIGGEVLGVCAILFVFVEGVILASSDAAVPDAPVESMLYIALALVWIHLGGRVLRTVRRHIVLNRAISRLEARLNETEPSGQG